MDYNSQKSNYSIEEQTNLERDFLEAFGQLKGKNISASIIKFIDDINEG
ncbi:hypothetical protein [Lacinutrix sp. Hel_I_90]|nr:hypothetical protein [Lacinutrix sp. Hel_I_90]